MSYDYTPHYYPHPHQDRCCFSAHGPRGSEGLGDTNYCVVNAIAAAFNIVWSEANQLLTRLGRKPKRGIATWAVMNKPALKPYGEAREAKWFYRDGARYGRSGMTIKSFLRECDPSKRYVVTVSGHALAVIDGKVRGESNLSRRVRYIWEVTPHLQRPGAINLPAIVNKNLTTLAPCASL